MTKALLTGALVWTLCVSIGQAADFTGKVVAVADGDTLTVLVERQQIKVRMVEIDAPESKQPYGQKSKESLADLCAGKQAQVADKGKDRYDRTLGRVTCNGADANAEQVKRGMAWVFDRYVTDKSLYLLQDEAKAEKRGLWADPKPVPPWEWRRKGRNAR